MKWALVGYNHLIIIFFLTRREEENISQHKAEATNWFWNYGTEFPALKDIALITESGIMQLKGHRGSLYIDIFDPYGGNQKHQSIISTDALEGE